MKKAVGWVEGASYGVSVLPGDACTNGGGLIGWVVETVTSVDEASSLKSDTTGSTLLPIPVGRGSTSSCPLEPVLRTSVGDVIGRGSLDGGDAK